MAEIYDVCIIGSGIAGTFAALRIAEKHSDTKTILVDVGRPPMKRRRQLEGFLGCFPTGDGKIYPDDLEDVKDLVDGRKAAPAFKWVMEHLKTANPMKLIKDSKPVAAIRKKIEKAGFDIQYNSYYQWRPKSVHDLSKIISGIMDEAKNVKFSFDNEVYSVRKQSGNTFVVSAQQGNIIAKKVLLCVGRSGWRWVTNLYDDLGIISSDDYARFGVKIEVSASLLRGFNGSHLTLFNEELDLGPFCWNGTVIQEDHSDLVISAFRSNEDRWKSDKVSFSLLRSIYFENQGSVQTDRIGKLAFLLFNDRVSKEKIRTFMRGKSQLNLIPEYEWLSETLLQLEDIIPDVCKKGYFHVPDIDPAPAEIRIGPNLETEIDGMFVAGEAAGVKGIAAAAIMGSIASDSACK